PVFAVIVVRDVSLLRSSEQRFGPLLEASPDALVIMRADGIIDAANELAEKMFGYPRHGLRGLAVEELVPSRLRERHKLQRAGFVRHPATRPMGAGNTRLLGMRYDGSEFAVDISLSPLQMGDGQMVVAAVRDMSARQAAEDALRELSARLEERVAERTAELEQSNRAFRATFEQAAVGIAHVALNGRWLRVNQQLCDMVGYSREEISGLTFQDITHPDDLNADLRLMYRVLAGEIASYDIEKRYVRKDGRIVWISLYASLVRDAAGTPEYFISVVQDIDARKNAEAGLQRHKEQLELAIYATGLGLFDFDPRSGAAEWSPELKRHFGLAPDAQVSLGDFFERLHPADRGRARAAIHHALAGDDGGRFQFDYRPSPCLDGDDRWFEARGQVLFEAGRPVRCVGTALEITAQKDAIDALERRERQLRTIIDANPIGTVVGTSRGQITDANAAFLRMIGRTRDELLAGQIHWAALTPAEHRPDDERAVAQAMRNGVSDLYEREFICAEGKRVPALLATASLGVDDQLVAFVLDISERKRAEEQIRHTALHD
ncbi:MAG TPA: PAS domain S-box protein, partial [Telluria sp.]|nr:PAS domain S-box protein [Telluria sp.]